MVECHINGLPIELLLQILGDVTDLNSGPPSRLNFTKEPCNKITSASATPIANLSLVCRRWRQIILPSLFKHACISLGSQARWLKLSMRLAEELRSTHIRKTEAIRDVILAIDHASASSVESAVKKDKQHPLGFQYISELEPYRAISGMHFHFVPSAKGIVTSFLHFLTKHDLVRHVKSLVLTVDGEITKHRGSIEETLVYREIKALWKTLFANINLCEVVVAAKPTTLAMLSGIDDEDWTDDWVFEMPYHYLRFSMPTSTSTNSVPSSQQSSIDRSRLTFLYNIRLWTSLAYNEGTMVRAYEHYEYQWKSPPPFLLNLISWLVKESAASPRSPKIESLEYISIFPFASHVDDILRSCLQLRHLRSLTVKLADPTILEDDHRMGKAVPGDLYQEMEQCYQYIAILFLKHAMQGVKFSSADVKSERLVAKSVISALMSHSQLTVQEPALHDEDEATTGEEVVRHNTKWTTWIVKGTEMVLE